MTILFEKIKKYSSTQVIKKLQLYKEVFPDCEVRIAEMGIGNKQPYSNEILKIELDGDRVVILW